MIGNASVLSEIRLLWRTLSCLAKSLSFLNFGRNLADRLLMGKIPGKDPGFRLSRSGLRQIPRLIEEQRDIQHPPLSPRPVPQIAIRNPLGNPGGDFDPGIFQAAFHLGSRSSNRCEFLDFLTLLSGTDRTRPIPGSRHVTSRECQEHPAPAQMNQQCQAYSPVGREGVSLPIPAQRTCPACHRAIPCRVLESTIRHKP